MSRRCHPDVTFLLSWEAQRRDGAGGESLTAGEGTVRLEKQAQWLEREYPDAAASLREGLPEMFTVNREQGKDDFIENIDYVCTLCVSLVPTRRLKEGHGVTPLNPSDIATQ